MAEVGECLIDEASPATSECRSYLALHEGSKEDFSEGERLVLGGMSELSRQ